MASALVLMTTVPCAECDNLAAKFHCDTCGKALCGQCKENHTKDKGTRHHTVVEYANKLNPKYLSGLLCHTHNTTNPEFWCDTCNVPICISCITEKHKGHTVSKITAILSQQRDAMREEMKALRDNTVGRWEEALNQAKQFTADHLQKVDNIDQELVRRAKELHKEVDVILSQARQTLQEMTKPGIDHLKEQEKYLANRVQQLKADVQHYEDKLTHANPNVLLQFKPGSIQPTEKPPTLSIPSLPVFTKGHNDTESMQKLIGDLSITLKSLIPNPAVQFKFDVKYNYPRIACVEGGLAWVETKVNTLQLVDKEGTVKDTISIDFDFYDITITSDGHLLLADNYNKCIKSVSKQRNITTLFRTSGEPWSLCYLHNGNIVVAFRYESKVTVFSREGKIRQKLDHIKLRYPTSVAVNKVNQDIYICDHEEKFNLYSKGKVIAVGADGKVRYEYTGQGDSKFIPVEVCADQIGHVLITDYRNHRVHMLDQEGQFIQYILTSKQGLNLPTTVDVDRKGYIWAGECVELRKGHVKVYRYLR